MGSEVTVHLAVGICVMWNKCLNCVGMSCNKTCHFSHHVLLCVLTTCFFFFQAC